MDKTSPLARLLGSSKALVMLGTALGAFALVGLGKISWEQAREFLVVTVPVWIASVGIEDAAKHLAAPRQQAPRRPEEDERPASNEPEAK